MPQVVCETALLRQKVHNWVKIQRQHFLSRLKRFIGCVYSSHAREGMGGGGGNGWLNLASTDLCVVEILCQHVFMCSTYSTSVTLCGSNYSVSSLCVDVHHYNLNSLV